MNVAKMIVGGAAAGALTALTVHQLARAAERDHPPKGRFVESGGVRLHVLERGAGEPILYIHGNGGMIAEVEATGLIDSLSAGHHVVVPDRPGFGHSPRPRAIDWTPERQAQAIGAMMEAVDDRPAIVIAHSWGTLVALALALDRPDRVRALILISGFYFPEPRSDIVLAAPAIPVVGDVMRYTISPVVGYATADKVFAKIFAPNPVTARFKAQFPVLMGLRPWQLRAAAEEVASMHSGAARLGRRYGEIRCPVVLLAGGSDQIINPHRQTERLARDIPQADLRLIDGVGHMLPHIDPDAVLEAVKRFEAEARPTTPVFAD